MFVNCYPYLDATQGPREHIGLAAERSSNSRSAPGTMHEIFRTNDIVLISWLEALLRGEGIETVVFDAHTSILEGSIGAIPRRMMVASEDGLRATSILKDAGMEYDPRNN
jgi:hypothetical protein